MPASAFLIFSGFNQRAVIAFCRFAEARGIPFSIIAAGPGDPIYRTAFARHVAAERTGRALEVDGIERLVDTARSGTGVDRFHLLPSTEYLNRFFLRWREHFERRGVIVPLCDAAVYERISDKASFCDLCSAAGLDIPAELAPELPARYPLVIKPRRYFDDRGAVQTRPLLVFDEAQHRAALAGIPGQSVFLQEFVRGDSYYLLYFVAPDGAHVSFSQRNLVQQADGLSMVAAVPAAIHLEPVGRAYLDLLVDAGFHGLIMIEIRRTGERDVMIEANPRLWGPSQLFVDCGVPLFDAFAASLGYDVAYEPGAYPPPDDRRYFWAGGIAADLAAGRELAWHGCSPADLVRELHLWLRGDVYLRPDTAGIFFAELGV
jgi:hypothetical protein